MLPASHCRNRRRDRNRNAKEIEWPHIRVLFYHSHKRLTLYALHHAEGRRAASNQRHVTNSVLTFDQVAKRSVHLHANARNWHCVSYSYYGSRDRCFINSGLAVLSSLADKPTGEFRKPCRQRDRRP